MQRAFVNYKRGELMVLLSDKSVVFSFDETTRKQKTDFTLKLTIDETKKSIQIPDESWQEIDFEIENISTHLKQIIENYTTSTIMILNQIKDEQ